MKQNSNWTFNTAQVFVVYTHDNFYLSLGECKARRGGKVELIMSIEWIISWNI